MKVERFVNKHTEWMMLLNLLVVLLLAGACQPIQPRPAAQADTQSAQEQFVAAAMALEQAYQDEDLEKVIAFYADDATSFAPGFPADAGKEAIKMAYQGFFDAYDIQRDFQLASVDMAGDFATRTGEWTQVLTPVDGGEPITEVGRCVIAFKQVDGEWKVAWEIWNTFEPSVGAN